MTDEARQAALAEISDQIQRMSEPAAAVYGAAEDRARSLQPAQRTDPGEVERAVRREIAALDGSVQIFHGSLSAMAVRLARAYDDYAGADLTKLARLNQELRQTLAALVEVGVDDNGDEAARLSTPVRDGEDTGPADAGAAGERGVGGFAAPAGQAADAAPVPHLRRRA